VRMPGPVRSGKPDRGAGRRIPGSCNSAGSGQVWSAARVGIILRRRWVLLLSAGVAVLWGAGPVAVPGGAGALAMAVARGSVQKAGSWGRAIPVPGLAALGQDASVDSVSCASEGNCAIGGTSESDGRGFVASERHGRWGQAIALPGLAALSKNGEIHLNSVSCGSAGNCAAGGYYFSSAHPDGAEHSFVAVERNGRWGRAIQLPGLVALSKGGDAEVDSLSCPSPGNCAAGGQSDGRGFVASERNGRWGRAIRVPGLAAVSFNSEVNEVSCGSAGNCAAGGDYSSLSGLGQGYVAVERNGVWGKAFAPPGLAALNKGRAAAVNTVSCVSAGSFAAGGTYRNKNRQQGFVASEKNGVWGKAIAVPGLAALNTGTDAEVNDVSCGSAGNCAAEGTYEKDLVEQVFVVNERNGDWGKVIAVPGLAALNKRGEAEVNGVSCGSAGNCALGGDYNDSSDGEQGFVATERNGVWGKAIAVPGLVALNKGKDGAVISVSCAPAGTCTAAGQYAGRSDVGKGFVVTQTR
jgi:hypothetical protein